MILCAFPTTLSIVTDEGPAARRLQRGQAPMGFWRSTVEAYLGPMRYQGGYPVACLCLLLFSLGVGPIFFTMLVVRDIVGIEETSTQQLHFGGISILFLICAAISSA